MIQCIKKNGKNEYELVPYYILINAFVKEILAGH